jgi:hypothetical protein
LYGQDHEEIIPCSRVKPPDFSVERLLDIKGRGKYYSARREKLAHINV